MAYIKMGWDKLRKLTQQPHTWTGVQTWAAGNIFKQLATPTTPDSGYHNLYFKADGYLYTKNSAGTEVAVVTNVNLDAQNSVKSIAVCTSAPPTEVAGDRYILDETAGTVHANWDGVAKKDIVQFDGTVWVATTPTEGMICEVEDVNTLYLYITSWNGWQNQATLTTSGPTFATLTLTTGAGVGLSLVSAAGGLGTWGVAGTSYYAQSAGTAGISGTATFATSAANAGSAGSATTAANAGIAGTAAFATSAANAGSASSATTAADSGTAYYATSSGESGTAYKATSAAEAGSAGSATTAANAGTAYFATSAGNSGIAGTSAFATSAANTGSASSATTAANSGTAYYATSAGNAGISGTSAFATSAAEAGSAGSATTAANSGTAYYSASAGTAGISGTASYSASAGTSGISGTASYATTAGNSGTAYYATSAGGGLSAASQAQAEAGTADTVAITPLSANWHPGAAKAWLQCDSAAGIQASWNITSVTDTGTGVVTVTIATDFSSTSYCVVASGTSNADVIGISDKAAGSFVGHSYEPSGGAHDQSAYYFACFGDQA